MLFDIVKTLVIIVFTFIVLITTAFFSPILFLFLKPQPAFKKILTNIVGALVIMGYDKTDLVYDVSRQTKYYSDYTMNGTRQN